MKVQKITSFQWSWTVFIALGLALIGMGASMRGWSEVYDFAALAFTIGGGTMIMVGLIYTLPSSNSLDIEDDGFSYRAGWKRVFCKWEDCSQFSAWDKNVFGLKANELVIFDTKILPYQARANIKTTGKNSVLPGTFGMEANALAEKMNSFRSAWLESSQTKPIASQISFSSIRSDVASLSH